jgi:glycosylphosphatidylinositol phospholipase D
MLKGLIFSTIFTTLRASVTYPTLKLSNLNNGVGTAFNGVSSNDASGTSVAPAGDVNGDGLNDFIIGAPFADPNGSNSGSAFVVFGAPTGLPSFELSALNGTNGFRINGVSTNDNTGISVAGIGDMNGDGVGDIVIGAHVASPLGRSNAGSSYVVFGKNTGFAPTLELSTLNGINGFRINGAVANERSGNAVAGLGDVNGDGKKDLIIGAPFASPGARPLAGSSYVIFGSSNPFNPSIDLATYLNGSNGFRINGVLSNDWCGTSLSSAGDINQDGIDDIIIGAPQASPGGRTTAGSCFVVFGKNSTTITPLELSTLDGTNGFRMNGVAQNDKLGISVSRAGDINNDTMNDIIMGAYGGSPPGRIAAGISFVFFGKRPPFNATIELSGINGTNGFRIYGVSTSDASGSAVSYANDFNGDGFNDLLIGAPFAAPDGILNGGISYVVFGPIQNTAIVDLALLSTAQSFTVTGGISGTDYSGTSLAATDLNGDGLSDIIIGAEGGSPGNSPGAGFTAVIFGDTIQLTYNQLTTSEGQSQIITDYNLNASVPNNPKYIQYSIIGLEHGSFVYTNQPDQLLSDFSMQDLITGRVNFTHDDSEVAYKFKVSAKHTIAITIASVANVTFDHQLPILVNNTLTINQGQTIQVGRDILAAVDPDNAQHNAGIIFTILSSSNGFFSSYTFPQTQLWDGGVYFTQDNTIRAPQYNVSISRGGVTIPAQSVSVDFATNPVLVNNYVAVCQGETKTLTSSILSANQPGANSSDALVFDISNIQYSHFESIDMPGVEILSFNQSDLKNNRIQFVHEGYPNPPNFVLRIHNNRITTPPYSPEVIFSPEPILIIKTFSVNQGETVVLTDDILKAIDSNTLAENLIFTVSNVKQGKFIHVNTSQPITQFNQSQVTEGEIAFKSNDISVAPSFSVSLRNSCSQTKPVAALIDYNSVPVLTNNQLTLTGGKPVILTPTELSATDRETSPVNLGFTVSAIENGHFEVLTLPGTPISTFSQQLVLNGAIRFVPDNNVVLPSYNVSVSDGILSTEPQESLVRLNTPPGVTVVNTPEENHTVRDAVISASITGVIGFALFVLKLCIEKRTKGALNNMLVNWSSKTEQEDESWRHNTLEPIVKIFFKKFKTTGFTGYRNEENTKGYIEAIQDLLIALGKYRKVDLSKLTPPERLHFTTLLMKKIENNLCIGNTQSVCCNCSPVFTPQEFKHHAEKIAFAVNTALNDNESSDTNTNRRVSIFPKNKFGRKDAGIQLVEVVDQQFPSDASHQGLEDQAFKIEQLKKEYEERIATLEANFDNIVTFIPGFKAQGVPVAHTPPINQASLIKTSMVK